jgi:hypothetical protein
MAAGVVFTNTGCTSCAVLGSLDCIRHTHPTSVNKDSGTAMAATQASHQTRCCHPPIATEARRTACRCLERSFKLFVFDAQWGDMLQIAFTATWLACCALGGWRPWAANPWPECKACSLLQ